MLTTDILVGLQHGDEGKGKISKYLCAQNNYDLCMRFNGGPNAGHTIYKNESKIVLHQVPIGIIYGIKCLIGPTCVLDITKLEKELCDLENMGFDNVRNLLFISNNIHVIQSKHINEDCSNNKVGTTCSGIGPTYRDKYARCGSRLDEVNTLCGCRVIDPIDMIYNNDIKSIFMEGAQGFELDIDWGDYPYVTSSSCLSGASMLSGISPRSVSNIWGISKLYDTYVGKKTFTDEQDDDLQRLQVLGDEFGATTGRVRQCNWLNLYRLRRSILINSVNHIVFNKCDIIKNLGVYKLYDINNTLLEFNSYEEMDTYIRSFIKNEFPYDINVMFSSSKYTL
tara:strand:+ start:14817 stop:15830 length:1014 start_codon:yes stop_codon:yes gene_type:complete